MNNVLILGAGLVSKPMVDYLLEKDYQVHIASRTLSKAEDLIAGHKNGKATQWTVEDTDTLHEMVKSSDVVVSLLPWTCHLQVADACLQHKKHMVTTSYVKEEMKNLDQKAKDAGILILNEIGLDPGIDHMSAMRTIHNVQSKGGSVESFRSLCGALPSPDASNNPLRYKFGWSPKGVALAGRNNGKYKEDSKIVDIEPKDLFKHHSPIEVPTIGKMEVYTNRDSLPYLDLYSIPEAKTIFRGTIRFPEWCNLWYVISNLGLLEIDGKDFTGKTFLEYMKEIVGSDDPKAEIAKRFNLEADSPVLQKLEWLDLFSNEKVKTEQGANIDVLVEKLVEKCMYADGEKDMVILQDEIVYELNGKRHKHLSTLIDYGVIGKATSVARTVSLPAACAVKLICENKINVTGVHIPVLPEIYNPVLDELKTLGIKSQEEETTL